MEPVDRTQIKVANPGISRHALKLADGSLVLFTISVPKSYDPETPIPLMVALHHGAEEITAFFGGQLLNGLMNYAFHDFDAIIVAPDAVGGTWTNEQCEKNLMELLAEIIDKYNIDRDKVLLTGFSLGGTGTWQLAARHQDLFTAAIPIAGRPFDGAAEVDWKIPLYVIHADRDEVITVNKPRRAVEELRANGVEIDYFEIQGVSHYQTASYIEPLRATISWLKKHWNMN